MRVLSKSGVDYSQFDSIEIWINGPEEGLLHIDLGALSEDVMWQDGVAPNGQYDTEDCNLDGRFSPGEDTGLDRRFNGQETCVTESCDPADPTGDDWEYDDRNEDDFSRINRTEGNGFLDTEDLDTNGALTRTEEEGYFHYAVNLNPAIEPPDALGAPGTGWRFYRIALATDTEYDYGNPQLSDIRMARLWFDGAASGSSGSVFQIASIVITESDSTSARR
jgi:hypothetical protein